MSTLEILDASVRLAVGESAEPRPGQVAATEVVAEALQNKTHAVAVCPTGSGKSFTLLSAAAWRCVLAEERTLISTESLSLQSQVLTKDAPVVVQAVRDLYDRELQVAVLKGTSNYVDPRQLTATAAVLASVDDRARSMDTWIDLVRRGRDTRDVKDAFPGVDLPVLRALVCWCFEQYADDALSGDRGSCPLDFTSLEWEQVSAGSAEACGADDHWLIPKAVQAKDLVAEADIVVVNHTLLAIQAATGQPIVNGNTRYGNFDNVLVDEAHALPDEVRKQGAFKVSGRTLLSLMRVVGKVAENVGQWESTGHLLTDAIEAHLSRALGREDAKKVPQDADPLGQFGPAIIEWTKQAATLVKPAIDSVDVRTSVKAKRAKARAEELAAAAKAVSTFVPGEARVLEVDESGGKNRRWTVVSSSPVSVSGRLNNNLWNLVDEFDVTHALGVAAVSATLPPGFPYQAGLRAQMHKYGSPFVDAYQHSALYIPSGLDTMAKAALTKTAPYGTKFDVAGHAAWATGQITQLVGANRGHALVLSAKAANGREYARALREQHPHLTVYSQWDGGTPAGVLARWREDPSSVLVGTRSMMTGVDAPGETCSLVVLDRIPRKPMNPQDDARVDEMVANGIEKWAADRLVYVSDAVTLMLQAKGRLIRSASDRGMFAVLDPRLLQYKRRAFPSYQESTRKMYMEDLYEFGKRVIRIDDAVDLLHARQDSRELIALP